MMKRADIGQPEGEHNRPRRPNPDTITYLRSLPLDLQVATDEINHFLSSQDSTEHQSDYPQSLAAALSAIDEIRMEIASLAGDEHAAEIIEILAHIAAPYSEIAARKLLFATAGYGLHLATHRYGSHVLQTILQLSISQKSEKDLALHDEAPPLNESQEELPSLTELLLALQEELTPRAAELSVHICGSHVLRTLLCVLGGVELVQRGNELRRGKAKRKKKKQKESDVDAAGSRTIIHMRYVSNARISFSDPGIQQALEQLTEAISGKGVELPGELQHLACHSSASPLFIVMIRVLTYTEARSEWEPKHRQEEEASNPSDHHLCKLREEPKFRHGSAAHALARRLLCWQEDKDEQPWAGDVIYGYSGEPRGSPVLETILRLSPDDLFSSIAEVGGFTTSESLKEYVEHEVSNFVVQTLLASMRTESEATTILDALNPLVTSGIVVDPSRKRVGILWRMVELAARFGVGQEQLLEAIQEGFVASSGAENKSIRMSKCVSKLLNLKKPDQDGGRVILNAAGTRVIYHLLRFEPRLCEDILKGILQLPQEELELLAKDGLGSRCIWDGMLEGPVKEQPFVKSLKQLIPRLSGRWVALAVDRVGHHSVKKLFRSLADMEDREKLVEELSQGMNRLSGNAMGRAVMDSCAVEEFRTKGSQAWRKVAKKLIERENFVKDIVSATLPVAKPKKEGRRKLSAESDSHKETKKRKHGTMDPIMDAISIPGGNSNSS